MTSCSRTTRTGDLSSVPVANLRRTRASLDHWRSRGPRGRRIADVSVAVHSPSGDNYATGAVQPSVAPHPWIPWPSVWHSSGRHVSPTFARREHLLVAFVRLSETHSHRAVPCRYRSLQRRHNARFVLRPTGSMHPRAPVKRKRALGSVAKFTVPSLVLAETIR